MNHFIEVHHGGGKCDIVEVTYITLMFFDTLHAELTRDFGDLSHFEYEDSDGDRIAVRGDDDMSEFVSALQSGDSNRIWLVQTTRKYQDIPVMFPTDLVNLSVLASGQFGTVYRTLHVPTDRIIAVKCLEVDEGSSDRERVLQEIMLMKRCDQCDFVVTLLGASLDTNTLLICLEYMNGGSLGQYGELPSVVLRHCSRSILEGLHFLWEKNIMHRDLKPSNILVDSGGYVKLSDFGLSKQMEHSIARSFVGTSVYMAPERIQGGMYRTESDIWSLGLTIWELVVGKYPIDLTENESPVITVGRITSETVHVKPYGDHDASLWTLIRKCVCHDVSNRWKLQDLLHCKYMNLVVDRNVISSFISEFIV